MEKTKDEFQQHLKKLDDTKDLHIHVAVSIALLSAVSSLAGLIAVLSVGFLESFRKDVAAFWLSCIPFCFPFITGLATAYNKRLINLNMHISVLLGVLLTGGAGYGYSVHPVFIERENCITLSESRGNCHRPILVYLYIIAGGVAAGLVLLGLLISFCACSSTSRRRAKQACKEKLTPQQQEVGNKEKREDKQQSTLSAPTTLITMATNEAKEPTPAPDKNPQTNETKCNNGTPPDAVTHL